MSVPVVRRAWPRDAEAISILAAQTFTDTFGHLYPPEDLRAYLDASYTPNTFRLLMMDPRFRVWVAENDGAGLLGYAQAGPCHLPHPEARPNHGEIQRLYVVREQQGTGLARQLMDQALFWIAAIYDGPVWLGVYAENTRAQRFYGRYGFSLVGEYVYRVGRARDREFILRRDE